MHPFVWESVFHRNGVCFWKAGQKVCVRVCVYCMLVSCWHVFVWADLIPSRMASAHYSSDIVLQTSPEGSACWEIKQRKWARARHIFRAVNTHTHTRGNSENTHILAKHWYAHTHSHTQEEICQTISILSLSNKKTIESLESRVLRNKPLLPCTTTLTVPSLYCCRPCSGDLIPFFSPPIFGSFCCWFQSLPITATQTT